MIRPDWFEPGLERSLKARWKAAFDVILLRPDPPVDSRVSSTPRR
jgi:hypothetical protein